MNASPFLSQATLSEAQLQALFKISSILAHNLDYRVTLREVLSILHQDLGLQYGLVTLLNDERAQLLVDYLHLPEKINAQDVHTSHQKVSYKSGEGIIGAVIAHKQSIVIPCIAQDHRFQDKLEVYALNRPFIAVPISNQTYDVIGVLAAQPEQEEQKWLAAHTRFLEMIGNLISRHIHLSTQVNENQQALIAERDRLRRKVRGNYSFDNMVGHTQAMRKIFDQIRLVSKWDTTVLIRGESGTGKELIANGIHYNSPRHGGAFVKLNCAALPEQLLESELFGHEKGAFTGAVRSRKGWFEHAHNGTLFLDEIGEISAAFQAKLLRVLQEGTFERVGGTETIKVDVRIIAATNRNLEDAILKGDFREDLYYRLNVMPVYPPPLRERMDDIPHLTTFLLEKLSKQQQRTLKLTDGAMRVLMSYHWPGNVRELENALERAAIMSETGSIDQDVIVLNGLNHNPFFSSAVSAAVPAPRAAMAEVDLTDDSMDERERVVAALEQAGWVQAKAARLLGMTPRQIAYRIQVMNIQMKQI